MGWKQIYRSIQQQGRGVLRAFDNFTDSNGTDLDLHTPDLGTSWTQNDADQILIQNNRAHKPSGSLALRLYLLTPVMPSADVRLEFKVYVASLLASSYIGCHFRYSTVTGDGYLIAMFSDGTDVFLTLYTIDADVPTTQVDVSSAISASATDTLQVVFEMEGDAYVGYVDDVEVFSGTDTFQAGGGSNDEWGVGAYFAGTSTTGLHLDDAYFYSL